jgi:hypothetical protein
VAAQAHPRGALAAELDPQSEELAKQATLLYREGRYQEAANLYAKLSVDHPDMPIFERNMGACFYYLKWPEPALSNLRNYLNHKRGITPDDKAVVDRWIEEMEQLRHAGAGLPTARPATPSAPAAPPPSPPTSSVAAAPPAAPAPTPATRSAPTALPAPTLAPAAPSATTTPPALNLSSRPSADAAPAQATPIYKEWWFWTGAGVVVAGAVTAILLATVRSTNVPNTTLGNQAAVF